MEEVLALEAAGKKFELSGDCSRCDLFQ
jgi:hypothetical protein